MPDEEERGATKRKEDTKTKETEEDRAVGDQPLVTLSNSASTLSLRSLSPERRILSHEYDLTEYDTLPGDITTTGGRDGPSRRNPRWIKNRSLRHNSCPIPRKAKESLGEGGGPPQLWRCASTGSWNFSQHSSANKGTPPLTRQTGNFWHSLRLHWGNLFNHPLIGT